MLPSLRIGVVALSLVSGVVFAGCAPITVHSYSERGAAFTYRTYAWAPADSVPTGDPRLDNNPFFSERVRAAVEYQLAGRGFEKTAASPDVLLHYHASITEDIDLSGAPDRFDACQNCGAFVFDAGTLVLDLVDARTSRLVWRGWAERVNPVIDNQDWMEETIDAVVARIIKQMPPRL